MSKKRFARLILVMFAGVLLGLSNTGYSSGDDSSDDSSDEKRSGLRFSAKLTGAQEVPGVDTLGMGRIEARFDEGFTKVHVRMRLRNLTGNAFAAHFHCAGAGVNGPVAFGLFSPGPCVLNGGELSCTFGNENENPMVDCVPSIGRPVENIVSLALAMRDGLIYTNVHTTAVGSGEVRGQMLED